MPKKVTSTAAPKAPRKARVVRDTIPQSRNLRSTIVPTQPDPEPPASAVRTGPSLNDIRGQYRKIFLNLKRPDRSVIGTVKQWVLSPGDKLTQSGGTCWWCTEPFTGLRHGCPVHYTERTDTLTMEGVFCSWNCALAYSRVYMSRDTDSRARHYIAVIDMRTHRAAQPKLSDMDAEEYETEIARRLAELPHREPHKYECAPHWSCLKKFGGLLTIDEFRSLHSADVRVSSYPERMHILPLGYATYTEDLKQAAATCLFNGMRNDDRNRLISIYRQHGVHVDHGFDTAIAPYGAAATTSANFTQAPTASSSTYIQHPTQFKPKNLMKRLQHEQAQHAAVQTHAVEQQRRDRFKNLLGIKK